MLPETSTQVIELLFEWSGFLTTVMLIRNKIHKDVSYFWIVEPQIESGYPHIHAGYFIEFADTEENRLKNHWSAVVKAGDFKHSLDFSLGSSYKTGDVSSLRNYHMKYMAKKFVDGMKDWTTEELVFNAIAWHEGYRFFGCSQDLSKVMKRMKIENVGILGSAPHCIVLIKDMRRIK